MRRLIGRLALLMGSSVGLAVAIGVGAHLVQRTMVAAEVDRPWAPAFGTWGPLLVFLVPAGLLVSDGLRLLRPGPVPRWVYAEVGLVGAVVAVLVWAVFGVPSVDGG